MGGSPLALRRLEQLTHYHIAARSFLKQDCTDDISLPSWALGTQVPPCYIRFLEMFMGTFEGRMASAFH